MSLQANAGEAFFHDGPKILCPHCDFMNPLPDARFLEGVQAVLCKRCQREIPVENLKE